MRSKDHTNHKPNSILPPKNFIMKKNTHLLSTLLIALFTLTFFSGCKKEGTTACLDNVPDEVIKSVAVSFDGSCSKNATTYAWDFGDGGMATTVTATHTYTAVGNYTVSLTVAGTSGTDVKTKSVTVKTCNAGYEGPTCTTLIRTKYLVTGAGGAEACSTGSYSYGVTITAASGNVTGLVIANLYNAGINCNATVQADGTFIIPSQTFGQGQISGTGSVVAGKIHIAFTVTSGGMSDSCTWIQA